MLSNSVQNVTVTLGIIGLPILCAATVRSVTHVNALCVYSRTYAPGEKPKLEYVIEQRVTAIAVHVIIGMKPIQLLSPKLKYFN